jgi:ferritin-like metal-binding protein YciE
MAHDQTTGAGATSDEAIKTYVMGLQNAHALEKQAIQLINRQLERIDHYPEVATALRKHHAETEGQIGRIEAMLHELGSDASKLKDLATQMAGNLAALGHTVMPDEILKNHFANCAFEAFEMATYKSLIAMARTTGHAAHVPMLEANLREEEATFQTLQGMTADLSAKFLQRIGAGQKADR